MLPAFHPDLAPVARWLPRGVGRHWALPLLRLSRHLPTRGFAVANLGDARAYVLRPAAPSGAALLWIHGGGLVIGDGRQDAAFLRRIVDELGEHRKHKRPPGPLILAPESLAGYYVCARPLGRPCGLKDYRRSPVLHG